MFTELLSSIKWDSHPCWKCCRKESPVSGTFPVRDRGTFWAESLTHTRGMCWQGLEEVCEKYIRNSYRKMSGRPLASLRCVPVRDPEPAGERFELHLQRLLTRGILEQTVASCCLNVINVPSWEKSPLIYVGLMYSGRALGGGSRGIQLLAALRVREAGVYLRSSLFVFCYNPLFAFKWKKQMCIKEWRVQ